MSKRQALMGSLIGLLLLLAAAGDGWQTPPDHSAGAVKVAAGPAPGAAAASPGRPETPASKEPAAKPLTGFPYTSESLNYSVNWPTGLSLGEAHLRAGKLEDGWQFDFSLDASVPGFAIQDHYRSRANTDLCSLDLEKEVAHGKRTGHEKTVFDYKAGSATRTTLVEGGGHTDVDINNCAHDGLDFVFYARRELGQGRVPQQEDVLLGASYSVRLEYTGAQEVTVNDKRRQADRVVAHVRGPSADSTVEILFDRDPARTPLIIKAPTALGTFSLELVR